MTLGFSTKWPDNMGDLAGQPNYFVNKVWSGLIKNQKVPPYGEVLYEWGRDPSQIIGLPPKLHTIREDPHNRWRPGMKIHPVLNNRSKDRFQFAPTLLCTGVQVIEITYTKFGLLVLVDGVSLSDNDVHRLALNDGFPSMETFFMWFNKDFKGKLIHWTDSKY